MHLIGVFAFFRENGRVIPQFLPFFRRMNCIIIQSYKKTTAERRFKMTVKQRVIASLLVEKAAENRELADKVGLVCRLKQIYAMRRISEMNGGEEE